MATPGQRSSTSTSRRAIERSEPVETALDVVVDIPLAALEDDPYPFYRWMREECPVVHVPETGRVWILTWDLCREAGVNDAVFGPTQEAHELVYGEGNVMSLTGEPHRLIRDAVRAPVQPQQVAGYYESGIRAATRHYLDTIRPKGEADATLEIFEPICQRVVGDALGFVDLDDATLSRWFHVLADYLVDYGRDAEVAERASGVRGEIRDYVETRMPQLAAEPDHSALSHLLHDGMPAGDLRPLDEILPTLGVTIVGGFQEPAHLVASTLFGLLSHPEQAQLVVEDSKRWARPAVEEGLRWLSPFGMTEKLTTEEVTIGGVLIPAGTEIALVIGSANRDPARFERPDEFDITRPDQANLSFGFGSHFCIGHNVARAIGEVVLTETFATLPNLRLDPQRPPTVHGWLTRAPKPMPVQWDV
jgi:cytochrome P450